MPMPPPPPLSLSPVKSHQVQDWVPSPLAPRSARPLMPYPLNVPDLRHFDSTSSWSPQPKWPSTPTPDDSASNQGENDADLITSDDPWYLDVVMKLVFEKVPRGVCALGREMDAEGVYGILKGCSDTRLPLELFALAINLMEGLGEGGALESRNLGWMERWMEVRGEHGNIHGMDDCQPEGDLIPSSHGTLLPSYFRPVGATPSPPPELFPLAILAHANDLLASSAHPMSQHYTPQPSSRWALSVSHARFGANQVRAARRMLGPVIEKMDHKQLWGKMDRRMDQIERHVDRTMKEEREEEGRGMEGLYGDVLEGLGWGVGRMWLGREEEERYEGTGVSWDDEDDDSGVNGNWKVGTEETRSVTVESWLDGIE